MIKIAAITDDGKTISQHFGRAVYYLVATVENGQIVNREMREKLAHSHFANEPHEAGTPGQPHGFSPAEQDRHTRMAQAIRDCQALLCRGMGAGAYQSMQQQGIKPVVTDIVSIDEAVLAYASGHLGMMLSPLHLCHVVSNQYFKTSFVPMSRQIALPAALMAVIIAAYFVLLLAIT